METHEVSNKYKYASNINDLVVLDDDNISHIVVIENIDLEGSNVFLNDITLLFEGGSIFNGILIGDYYIQHNEPTKIFGLDVFFNKGVRHGDVYPEWFGASVNAEENILPFRKCIELFNISGGGTLNLTGFGSYNFSNQAADGQWDDYKSDGSKEAILHWTASNVVINIEPQSTLQVVGNIKTTSSNPCRLFSFVRVKNIQIKGGGHVRGNRQEIGNNDFDFAIYIYGKSENIKIENITISEFPADFLKPQISRNYQGQTYQTWELGGIDQATGDLIDSNQMIRSTVNYPLTYSRMVNNGFFYAVDIDAYSQLEAPGGFYDVYFYDNNDVFISTLQDLQMYEKVMLPENAIYAKVTLKTTDLSLDWNLDLKSYEVPSNILIKGCTAFNMGRQIISATGFQDVVIRDNVFYNVYGNPGAIIDFEDGRFINRRVRYINNTSWNCQRHIIMYNPWDIVIKGNSFLSNRDGRGNVNGVFVAEKGGRISVTDNYFENTNNQIVPYVEFTGNNVFVNSLINVLGGTLKDAVLNNSKVDFKNTGYDLNFGTVIAENLVFNNDNQKLINGYSNSIQSGEKHPLTPTITLKNITINGIDKNDSISIKDGINVDGLTLNNVSGANFFTHDITNVKTNSNITIWGSLEANENLFLENFTFNNNSSLRFRTASDSTNNLYVKNIRFNDFKPSYIQRAIDIDDDFGHVQLDNVEVFSNESIGTNWSLINFDKTVNTFVVKNSEFITNSTGNLMDLGNTTSKGFIYKDNTFSVVNVNTREDDILYDNIINGVYIK